MSKISLKPSTSGTADYTITSPSGSTDRTLALPDEAGTVLTTATDLEPQVKDSLNATGSAPVYACRAWVNFNSRSGNTIRDSGNVSSITDSGTGIQTVNFATAMPDNDYAVSFYMKYDGSGFNDVGILGQDTTQTSSASSFPFFTWRDGGDTGLHDFREVHISFFR